MLRRTLLSGLCLTVLSSCVLSPSEDLWHKADPVTLDAFDMRRCVNMGNSLDSPKGQPWGAPVRAEDFVGIAERGFDTVRLPVRFSEYTGPGPDYTIEPDFLLHVQSLVDAALAQGLNVMLDVHHFQEIMREPAQETPKLTAIWGQLGEAFAGYPDDLWFEILNEPMDKLSGAHLRTAQRAATERIRATNPDRIIIYGGEHWSGIAAMMSSIQPPDENIVYTFHYYKPYEFTHQGASWLGEDAPPPRDWGSEEDYETLRKNARRAASISRKLNRPVFLGEFGVDSNVSDSLRQKWTGAVRAEMEAEGIPWCLWSYTNTFALYDGRTGFWDTGMLDALGMPAGPGLMADLFGSGNAESPAD